MVQKKRCLLVFALVTGVVALDQLTKYIAIQQLQGQPATEYWGGLFKFIFARNTGAFLSLGSQLSENARFWALTAFNGAILSVVSLFLFFKTTLRTSAVIALSFILAGGVGNLIDRICRDGHVVDFMNMGITIGPWPVRTGIFNVADVAIMAGLFLLIVLEFMKPKTETPEAAEEPAHPTVK